MGAFQSLKLQIDTVTTGEEALDALTAKLDKVAGSVDNFTNRMGKSRESAPKVDHFQNFAKGIEGFVSNPLETASQKLGGFVRALGAGGTAILTAGAVAGVAVKSYVDLVEQLGKAAEAQINLGIRTGLTVKEVGQFSIASKLAGVDISSMETGMRALSQAVEGTGEKGKSGREAIEKLGISLYDTNGTTRQASQIWLDLSGAISNIRDPFKRMAVAQEIFGRGAKELLPLLIDLKNNVDWAKGLDFGLSDETAKQLDEAQDKLEKIWAILEGIAKKGKVAIALTLEPAIDTALGTAEAARSVQTGKWKLDWANFISMLYGGGPRGGGQFSPEGVPLGIEPTPEDVESIAARGRIDSYLKRSENSKAVLEEAASKAKEKYESARLNLEGLKKTRNLSPQASDEQVDRVEKLRLEYEKATAAVKALADAERNRETALSRAERDREAFQKGVASIRDAYDKYVTRGVRTDPMLGLSSRGRSEVQMLLNGSLGQIGIPGLAEQMAELDVSRAMMSYYLGKDLPEMGDRGVFQGARTGLGVMFAQGRAKYNEESDKAHLDALQQEAAHRLRMLELTAGPGGEFQAALKAYQERIRLAKEEFEITRDGYALANEQARARYDYEEKILELQNKQRDAWKSATSRGFEALISGGSSGLQALAKSQLVAIGSTVAGNAGGMLWDSLKGSTSGLNLQSLLAGTPFGGGKDRTVVATDSNTAATNLNTAAVARMTAALSFGGSGSSVGGADLASLGTITGTSQADSIIRLLGGSTSAPKLSSLTKFLSGIGMLTTAGSLGAAITGNDYSVSTGAGTATTASALGATSTAGRLGTAAGGAGAIAAGTFGALAGFSAGGAQGNLTGTASVVGTLGAVLPMLSKSLSFLGPAGMAAGLGLGLIASLFGNPKQKRAEEQARELRDRRYFAPTSLDITADASGNYVDYDAYGNLRTSNLSAWPTYTNSGWKSSYYDKGTWLQSPGQITSPYSPGTTIVQNINYSAIDARSLIERGADIAEATRQAVLGSQADNLVRDLRDSIVPA